MIIQLEKGIEKNKVDSIQTTLSKLKFSVNPVTTQFEDYLVCIGKTEFDIREIGHLQGVKDVQRVSDNYKLVSNKWKTKNTIIDLGDDVVIGPGTIIGSEGYGYAKDQKGQHHFIPQTGRVVAIRKLWNTNNKESPRNHTASSARMTGLLSSSFREEIIFRLASRVSRLRTIMVASMMILTIQGALGWTGTIPKESRTRSLVLVKKLAQN